MPWATMRLDTQLSDVMLLAYCTPWHNIPLWSWEGEEIPDSEATVGILTLLQPISRLPQANVANRNIKVQRTWGEMAPMFCAGIVTCLPMSHHTWTECTLHLCNRHNDLLTAECGLRLDHNQMCGAQPAETKTVKEPHNKIRLSCLHT